MTRDRGVHPIHRIVPALAFAAAIALTQGPRRTLESPASPAIPSASVRPAGTSPRPSEALSGPRFATCPEDAGTPLPATIAAPEPSSPCNRLRPLHPDALDASLISISTTP